MSAKELIPHTVQKKGDVFYILYVTIFLFRTHGPSFWGNDLGHVFIE